MKYFTLILGTFLIINSSIAQTIGTKVSLVGVDGKTYTGVIITIQGDKYKVKYDGYDFDAWLTATQFRVIDAARAVPIPPQKIPKKNEPQQPAIRNHNSNVPTRQNLEAWMDKYIAAPAEPGMDGAISYKIISFKVGNPRKWQYNDGGSPANGHNTDVYPIKLHFLKKWHYRTRTHVVDGEYVFSAFKNGFGEWNFGYSANPSTKKEYDEAPDMK